MKPTIAQLLRRPPADWHDRLLAEIARVVHPRCYVEVGIYHGETFRKIARFSEAAIAVDIDPAAAKYVRGLTARFVGQSLSSSPDGLDAAMAALQVHEIDLAFIDGDHRSEAALTDFSVIEARASANALIALHDTWPRDAQQAEDRYCADSYRVPEMIRERFADSWTCITIPVHPGLTLCSRAGARPAWLGLDGAG